MKVGRRTNNKPNESRGRWLISKIKERGLTVYQVCKILGVSQNHFYKLLSQPMNLTMSQIVVLSGVIQEPVRDVLAWIMCSDAEIGKKSKYWFE